MFRRLFEGLLRRFFSARASFIFRKKVYAHGLFTVVLPSNVSIGTNCSINAGVVFSESPKIVIGNRVTLSARVIISKQGPNLRTEIDRQDQLVTSIGDDAWIGAGAIINPGVKIGERAVVGAGSVVTADIPADGVAIGNPAETVKKRTGFESPLSSAKAANLEDRS